MITSISKFSFYTLVLLFFLPGYITGTAPFSVALESARGNVIVVIHREDASEMAAIQARLQQDLVALEHVFTNLITTGLLDGKYPRLIIEATKQFEVNNRFETHPTTLTRSGQAILECNNPDGKRFDPRPLGPAYVIKTSTGLLHFPDLLALVLMLPEVEEKQEMIHITDEEKLEKVKRSNRHKSYLAMEFTGETSPPGSGNYRLSSGWREGKTIYRIIGEPAGLLHTIYPLEVYLTPPAWLPPISYDINSQPSLAYASPSKIVFHAIETGIYHILNIQDISQGGDHVEQVQFMASHSSNTIYAFISGTMGSFIAAFSLDLNGDEWLPAFSDLTRYQASDLIASMQMNGELLPFIPVFNNRLTRNAEVTFSPPLDVSPQSVRGQNQGTKLVALLGLIVATILVLYFNQKRERSTKKE